MTGANMQVHGQRPTVRWQWYHYYFLLAVFDLLVIVASLLAYHHTVSLYDVALTRLAKLHAKQRWVAGVRLAVVDLNAPGNDVFATRQIDLARDRFTTANEQLEHRLRKAESHGIDTTELERQLQQMIEYERSVFTHLEHAADVDDDIPSESRLTNAAEAMAAMDRYQAAALTTLTEMDQHFLMRVDGLLTEYGLQLISQGSIEKSILSLIVLVLVGVFWYGRKLQNLHERMVSDHQTALLARQERLAAIGELCTAVAHGIRNPLASVLTSAQLALVPEGAAQVKRRLSDIVDECRRLDRRLTRLLQYARGCATATEEYGLQDAALQACEELRESYGAAGIRLSKDMEAKTLIVRGEREGMVQAIIEVLANALEYTPSGATVSLRCARDEDHNTYAAVTVSDPGPGIAEANRVRAFELFYTTREGGTGIGLAFVKNAANIHGGDVRIGCREDGTGTTVCLRVPILRIGNRSRAQDPVNKGLS